MDYYVPLLPGNCYHICSRATGNEKLFLSDENYRFFLSRYDRYITPVAETFAWALLPNHFHFLVQFRSFPELLEQYKKIKPHGKEHENCLPDFIMQRFSNLLNSYARSFNKRYNRRGSLFMDYLRRVEVKTDAQYSAVVFYIHKNPVHHGYCKNITDWPWTSYKAICSDTPTKLKRQMVLDWFGGREKFVSFHSQPIDLKDPYDRNL